jgi:Mn2+/Fe2+ NRAMP family transporter
MRTAKDWAVVILAISFGVALILVCAAVLWNALHNGQAGLSVTENDTQLLMAWGGGIIGILGAVVGGRIGERRDQTQRPPRKDQP